MHKDAASLLECILDEFDCLWKVLEQILIVDVILFDDLVREAFEERLVQRQPQYREHMRYPRCLQRVLAAQGEQTSRPSESRFGQKAAEMLLLQQ